MRSTYWIALSAALIALAAAWTTNVLVDSKDKQDPHASRRMYEVSALERSDGSDEETIGPAAEALQGSGEAPRQPSAVAFQSHVAILGSALCVTSLRKLGHTSTGCWDRFAACVPSGFCRVSSSAPRLLLRGAI